MDNNSKVIRFPDGKGGFILKRRNDSGIWEEVNEDGSAVASPVMEAVPTKEKPHQQCPARKKDGQRQSPTRYVGLRLPPALDEDLEDFVRWRSFTSRTKAGKSEAVSEALELLFRKYPGFKEYRSNR